MALVRLRRGLPMHRNSMVMRGRGLRGLGADCGDDPCTWVDAVYLRDACLAYKACVNPNDPAVILANKGLIVGSATIAGSTAGQAVGQGVESAVTGIFTNPSDPNNPVANPLAAVNWVMVGGAFLALLLLPRLIKG